MKNDKRNRIDNYFYDGLDNMNIIPPADVWNNIAENLPRRSNNRAMFIWIAAASISLFAAIGSWMYLYSGRSSSENTNLVATENTGKGIKNSPSQEVIVNESSNSNKINSDLEDIAINNDNTSKIKSQTKIKKDERNIVANKNRALETFEPLNKENKQHGHQSDVAVNSDNKTSLYREIAESNENTTNTDIATENSINTAENNTPVQMEESLRNSPIAKLNPIALGYLVSPEKNAINFSEITRPDTLPIYEDVYAFAEETQNSKAKNRWAIGGQMAPLYSYRNITDVNSPGLTEASMNEIEKAVITYSSGIIVDYEASSRLTFQTGVNYMKMGQEINNVSNFTKSDTKSAYLASASKEYADNKAVINSTGTIVTETVPLYFEGSVNSSFMQYAPGNLATQPADLDSKNIEQSFEFIEVPFLAKYKIIDRKINVHLLGGVSTNFLVNNKSILKSESATVKGKTSDVETLNYSSSVGFGVVYKLNKSFMLSVEPTFKYYLNSFNSTDAVKLHPYAFGIYSGLTFKF